MDDVKPLQAFVEITSSILFLCRYTSLNLQIVECRIALKDYSEALKSIRITSNYSILMIRIFAILMGFLTGRTVVSSWTVNAVTHN
jgi:hypothetical protein